VKINYKNQTVKKQKQKAHPYLGPQRKHSCWCRFNSNQGTGEWRRLLCAIGN